jgi:hypothetical protein
VTAAALVDWTALLRAVGVSAAAALGVAVLFALAIVGSARRQWALVVVGLAGCVAAAALGVVAMTHK